MNNKTGKFIAAAFLLSLLFPSGLLSGEYSPREQEWDIQVSADEIEYARKEEAIFARGNVKITYLDMVMTAAKMTYSRRSGIIESEGNINFERDFFTIESSSMIYNIHTGTGHVYFARVISSEILDKDGVSTPPLVIEADSIDLRGDDEFFIPRGKITTCDEDPPHYYFSGSSLYVKLEDRFSLRNALFVVRGVVVFYYPYYRRELGPRRLMWHLDAGSSKIKGTFLRAGASYPLTENSRTGLGLEVMQKGGPGIYLDHGYSREGGKADFEAYYLSEDGGSQGRLEAGGRQEIFPDLTARFRGQYSSERMIEHDYFGEESYGVDTLYWLGGAEYSGGGYTLSVYGDRAESWQDDRYNIDRMTLPGLSGRIYSFDVGGKFIFDASAEYRRRYRPLYENFYSDTGWESSLRRNFRLNMSRRSHFSFTPGIGYEGEYVRGRAENFLSFFSENRAVLGGILTADSNYTYRAEYGFLGEPERSFLRYRFTLEPYRPLRLRTGSAYDFTDENEPVGDVVSEGEYTPGFVGLFLRNRYHYYRRQSQWLGELTAGEHSRTVLRYEETEPGVLDIDQQVRFRLGPFDLMPAVRFKTTEYTNFDRFTEKRLDVLWDMHCWQSRFRLRRRGEETEMWMLFNITVFPQERVGLYGNLAPDIMDFRYHKD